MHVRRARGVAITWKWHAGGNLWDICAWIGSKTCYWTFKTFKPLLNVLFLYVDSSVMYLELYKYIICRKCILHACQTCQRCGDSNKTGIPGAGGGSFPRPQQISYFGQEFGRESGILTVFYQFIGLKCTKRFPSNIFVISKIYICFLNLWKL